MLSNIWYHVIGVLMAVHIAASLPYYDAPESNDKQYWQNMGQTELLDALRLSANVASWNYEAWNTLRARNVILFVGNGMDPNTVTAARVYKIKENGKLAFESFPHMGLLKTYSANKLVPDSAAAATALFSGTKTNNGMVGLDARVQNEDCSSSMSYSNRLGSIVQWAQEASMDTGFVTTNRVTHATASALYAHSPSKYWECDADMPRGTLCKDIARQLIEDEPGRNLKVIFGGGRQCLNAGSPYYTENRVDLLACKREDGKNLIQEWKSDKAMKRVRAHYVETSADLKSLDPQSVDYVLGLFAMSTMPFEYNREKTPKGPPSLMEMTAAALEILVKSRFGFLLVVESGLIDAGHHEGHARKALDELTHLDTTVEKTMELLNRYGIINDTLVIVTGDHGHTMAINGYPDRGVDILGIAQKSKSDDVPYTILTYSTGKANNYHYVEGIRQDPSLVDTTDWNYAQQAAIITDEETHSGSDIPVYARGPMAHLFHNVHEQNYVAHVIGWAARIGPYRANVATTSAAATFFTVLFPALTIFLTRYIV